MWPESKLACFECQPASNYGKVRHSTEYCWFQVPTVVARVPVAVIMVPMSLRTAQLPLPLLVAMFLPSCLGPCCLGVAAESPSGKPSMAGEVIDAELFERQIRPLLADHCYECHAADSEKIGGGLLLDSRDGLITGGDSGPAIVPGDPDRSLLMRAVRYVDDSLQMPPQGMLSETEITSLETWIRQGAPDPRIRPANVPQESATPWEEVVQQRSDWWSLQPVREVIPPDHEKSSPQRTGAWPANAIDRFVLANLGSHGLIPADSASPSTFLRRLSLVLTGLPPSADETASFEQDCQRFQLPDDGIDTRPTRLPRTLPTKAVAKLVDRLLESPAFGERWARHWLDVVRFTETHGIEWNYEVHHAWRYRDYLIRAFNQDVPYDQFIREHIAGDLLPQPRWNESEQTNESIVATAFYRFGEVNHDDCISLRELGFDMLDNQIDTLTKAFQATTVACARCHDHKLDAVSARDYYGILGILRSSRLVAHTLDSPAVNQEEIEQLGTLKQNAIRTGIAAQWRAELDQIAPYMLAAEAQHTKRADAQQLAAGLDADKLAKWTAVLSAEKVPIEDLFAPWRAIVSLTTASSNISGSPPPSPESLQTKWRSLAEQTNDEQRKRSEYNQRFELFGDFRASMFGAWSTEGQGLRREPTKAGDFIVSADGPPLVVSVLPAGCFTHSISAKLNGTLRSPQLPSGKSHISFEVMGRRSSAVRLVSNNCQLNYVNYRALTDDKLRWVTFEPPGDRDSLRTYAELMTMFDNPKFPDQLAGIGGDPTDYRVPWDEAAANPRSYFGVTRVVTHDGPDPPQAELTHLLPLFHDATPCDSTTDVVARYVAVMKDAVRRWNDNLATDDDVRWLDGLLQQGLVDNRLDQTPELREAVQEYRRIESQIRIPQVSPGIAESGSGYDQSVFVRGDCRRPGEPTPRRYLEVLADRARMTSVIEPDESGRRWLAEQIASRQNPLTARVMVNRIWQHLFGMGLVRTVDDFGHVGDVPSHPELLDYLALQFMNNDWSIKTLIRSIVVSHTFQVSNVPSPLSTEVDPLNRLLQHYPARRLEGEAIRDSMLAVSGRLDNRMYGASVYPHREEANANRRLFPGPLDGAGRRSVYIKNTLMEAPKFLNAFNLPGGKVAQGRRDTTNVPAQALALLNDPFVLQQADVWAESLLKVSDPNSAARIQRMVAIALGRDPTRDELQRLEQAVDRLASLHQVAPGDRMSSRLVWRDMAHAMFNLKEFIYIP